MSDAGRARPEWRGDRRIRVALEVTERSVRPAGMWVLQGPAVQRPSLAGSHVARVDVSGVPVLLQSFEDPRLVRGVARPDRAGHSYQERASATLHVDVPLRSGQVVDHIAIRIADLSGLSERPTDPAGIVRILDDPAVPVRWLPSVTMDQLAEHRDWEAVARETGLRRPPA